MAAAQRVPTLTGSLTEVTAVLGKKITVEELNAAMKAAANESFGYTEDEIVSSDIIGMYLRFIVRCYSDKSSNSRRYATGKNS